MKRLFNGSDLSLIIVIATGLLFVTACYLVRGETLPRQRGPLGVKPTTAEIELGRRLFFDKRISRDGTVACATCHDPARGWSDGLPVAVGIGGRAGTRNSPTLINVGWVQGQMFWDGRARETSDQALLPMSNPIEMGQQSEQQVVARLRNFPEYVAAFAQTFGVDQQTGQVINGLRLARSLAAFQATITSADAPIDRYRDGDRNALTPEARIGYEIFAKANCMACHVPPLYTDGICHNNGSEFAGKQRATDQGQFSVAGSSRGAETVRAFKTPTLREIQRTAPYMHAGQFDTIERVVAHYNAGGANFAKQRDRFTDQRIKPLGLTETQADYLVAFLKEAFAGSSYPMIEAP